LSQLSHVVTRNISKIPSLNEENMASTEGPTPRKQRKEEGQGDEGTKDYDAETQKALEEIELAKTRSIH